MSAQGYWKRCSVCKKEIVYSRVYYNCSVSTCNRKRAPHVFCTVTCWDTHNAVMGHRDAGAEENVSPAGSEPAAESAPRRRIVASGPKTSSPSQARIPKDILVVVSKLKAYIKARADMNTSADVMPALSDIIRRECDKAAEKAREDGRKTVMARDF